MNPWQGEYETKSFINSHKKETDLDIVKQFGTTEKRFNDKYTLRDKCSAPGPGYYEPKIATIA